MNSNTLQDELCDLCYSRISRSPVYTPSPPMMVPTPSHVPLQWQYTAPRLHSNPLFGSPESEPRDPQDSPESAWGSRDWTSPVPASHICIKPPGRTVLDWSGEIFIGLQDVCQGRLVRPVELDARVHRRIADRGREQFDRPWMYPDKEHPVVHSIPVLGGQHMDV